MSWIASAVRNALRFRASASTCENPKGDHGPIPGLIDPPAIPLDRDAKGSNTARAGGAQFALRNASFRGGRESAQIGEDAVNLTGQLQDLAVGVEPEEAPSS